MPSRSSQRLTGPQQHRAAGVLLGMAAGDALGAGYEFGPPLPDDESVVMGGGGSCGWEPGEWTDDTSMALVIAQAAAAGDLTSIDALDRIARGWRDWSRVAKDVGSRPGQCCGPARLPGNRPHRRSRRRPRNITPAVAGRAATAP